MHVVRGATDRHARERVGAVGRSGHEGRLGGVDAHMHSRHRLAIAVGDSARDRDGRRRADADVPPGHDGRHHRDRSDQKSGRRQARDTGEWMDTGHLITPFAVHCPYLAQFDAKGADETDRRGTEPRLPALERRPRSWSISGTGRRAARCRVAVSTCGCHESWSSSGWRAGVDRGGGRCR